MKPLPHDMTDEELLKAASLEVASWPKWLQLNADLLFEEEQEKQRKESK